MARIALHEATTQRLASRSYRFTVIFQPLAGEIRSAKTNGNSRSRRLSKNSAERGYQVTVPMLPRSRKPGKWPLMPFAFIWRDFAKTANPYPTKRQLGQKSCRSDQCLNVPALARFETAGSLTCFVEGRV